MSSKDQKSILFKQAQQAYFENDRVNLRKLTNRLKKLGPFNLKQKRTLSNFLNILGNTDDALRVLGKIMGTHELNSASEVQLAIQADIASKLVFHSANYTASRLFQNVEENIKQEIKLSSELEKWPFYKAQYLSYTFRSKESIEAVKASIAFYKKVNERPEYKFSHLIYLKSLIDNEKYQEALDKAEKFESIFSEQDLKFKIFLDANKAEAYLALKKLDKAKAIYEDCIERELKSGSGPTTANLYRSLGDIYRLKGNKEEASKNYSTARKILEKYISGPTFNWFPLLYSIEKFTSLKFTFAQKLFLRLFPAYSPYTGLIEGTNIDSSIPPQHRDAFTQSNEDSWIVNQNSINEINYKEALVKTWKKTDRVIDLVSGRVKEAGTHQFEVISLKQARALRALLGSGHLGIKQFHLLDYIYRQDFIDPVSGQDRLKKLVSKVKKNGFSITLKKTRYSLAPEKGDIFICNKGNKDAHPLNGLSYMGEFTRRDVEDFLGIKRSRAGILLAEWIEEELVCKKGPSSYKVL